MDYCLLTPNIPDKILDDIKYNILSDKNNLFTVNFIQK